MGIVDWIFPKVCSGCRREGKYICDDCQKRLVSPDPICPECGKSSLDGWTHPRCKRWGGMERLIVGLPYKGLVQQCLKKVKYKSAWEIVEFLFVRGMFEDVEGVVTSVPMWGPKQRVRGFNQAEILAKLIAEKNKVTNLVLLERVRETKPMFGLKKTERQKNIQGAFRWIDKDRKVSIPKQVILVDDVWTTGATMRECSLILKQEGVDSVIGVTLAR